MKPRVWIPLVVVLLLALGVGATIWAKRSSNDAEVEEAKELGQQLFNAESTPEQREQAGERMRELVDNMSDEQRREMRRGMMDRMVNRAQEFAALPEDQRNAFLDQDIDRFEEMRQQFGRGGRGGRGDGEGRRRRPDGARGDGPPRGDGGRGGRGGRPDWRNMSEEERQAFRRQRFGQLFARRSRLHVRILQGDRRATRRTWHGTDWWSMGPAGSATVTTRRAQWITAIAAGLLLLVAGTFWALRSRPAPEITEMKQLAEQLFTANSISEEQSKQLGRRMRELKENIPKDRREEVFAQMEVEFTNMVDNHVRTFSSLPDEQRDAFLDRDIDRMQTMGRAWSSMARAGKGNGKKRDRGERRNWSAEEKRAWRRQRLDQTSAEDRAYRAEYKQAIKRRLLERGIESFRGRKID